VLVRKAVSTLTPSPWLYAFLRGFERFRPTAYLPTPRDRPTIGYGHTRGVKMGDTCTLAQALSWLQEDAQEAVGEVRRFVQVLLSQNEFDALCSLTFNCGPNPLELTLGHKLNAGDYAGRQRYEFPVWTVETNKRDGGYPVWTAAVSQRDMHFLTA
jgi:lysozyme